MLQSLRSKVFTAGRAETPASGGDAPASALDGVALLEAIVCETQTEAMHAGVVASGLNALRLKQRVKAPQSLKNFLPRDSAVVGELLRAHEEAGLSGETTIHLREVLATLAASRAGPERFFAEGGRDGEPLSALASQWMRLSEQLAGALMLLQPEISGRLPDYYASNSATLVKVLTSAAGGAHPCIDAAGDVVLPDLTQRRRAARRSLLQQVTLRHRGKNTPVIAKDISATGLGLDRVPELKLEELVQIEMTGGRRLMGMVVWIRGVTAGIRLGKPLPPNDPLLGG
ncbi:MAG TPA: PilZ domain-containing protein [Hyphomicrobiaceae bacterium]